MEEVTANAVCRAQAASRFDMLDALHGRDVARNTLYNYRTQWRSFIAWALSRDIQALPAEPVRVAAYLEERFRRLGHKPATIRMAAAAVAFVHRAAGMDDPCASPEVRRAIRGAAREAGRRQKQADALTAEALAVIRSTVLSRRRGRGGQLETVSEARRRGRVDLAMMGLMRDAMLRVSEAAALVWGDLKAEPDGSGRLLIRRSKTDSNGEGAVAFVSAPTMRMLRGIRRGAEDTDGIFGLRRNQIAARIKQAARVAGLGNGFSGHSPRVGMARDLARAGIELPSLMNAGRWRTPAMPAHYTRNESAGRGAVARFHGYCR